VDNKVRTTGISAEHCEKESELGTIYVANHVKNVDKKIFKQHDTYQLRRARTEADGEGVSYPRHTVHKCEEYNVVICHC